MNILKRNLLHQITLKAEVVRNTHHMQGLLIHRSHQANGPLDPAKTKCIYSIDNSYTSKALPRWYSSEVATEQNSMLARFVGLFRTTKSVISGKAVLIYAEGVDRVNHTEFTTKFNMANTFNTWFLITEIHVWMLMVRAMAERDRGQLIRNNIVESLWADALTRSKTMAPDDSRLVKKQIEELSGQFQYAIVSYDEGLTKDDRQLASALWKRFFNSNCDDYEHIELMVKYIRLNISILDNMSSEEFLTKRNFDWPSLKDIENGKY